MARRDQAGEYQGGFVISHPHPCRNPARSAAARVQAVSRCRKAAKPGGVASAPLAIRLPMPSSRVRTAGSATAAATVLVVAVVVAVS
jgi:hypothetical protein